MDAHGCHDPVVQASPTRTPVGTRGPAQTVADTSKGVRTLFGQGSDTGPAGDARGA